MSAVDSTDHAGANLIAAAARGELPAWAEAGAARREHMARVAELLGTWAEALGLSEAERQEWRALGYLHDALRDADPEQLRGMVPPEYRELPGPLLHGPAAAELLSDALSPAAVRAVRFHTIGHPDLDRLGRAVYLADFLEPGRDFQEEWRASLVRRMPADMDQVLREVLAARIRYLLDGRKPIRPETAAFWTALVRSR